MYRCVCVCECVCEYVCIYISAQKMRLSIKGLFSKCDWIRSFLCSAYVYMCMIKHHQLTLQANNYKWLVVIKTSTKKANRQTNKQTNKKIFTVVGAGTWSVLLRRQSKNVCIEIPKTIALFINWSALPLESPYLQLRNAKLNPSNFTVTSSFDREINYTCIGWHSPLE